MIVNKFHSHARFLITSMLEGQDDQDWHKSPFLRYYKHYFPVSCVYQRNSLLAYGNFQVTYDEVESRLHPRRQPKQAKAASPAAHTTAHQKQGAMAQRREKPTEHRNVRRSGRQAGPEIPRTPKQSSRHTVADDTSGDESYDSNERVIQAGTKRKSKSILQPKGSKFSKKAAGRRQSLPSITDQADEKSADSDDEAERPELSPLAAVTQREPLHRHQPSRRTAEVKMVTYDIPSDRPQGPGDLWTCTFENCNHRVHQGLTSKGTAQIKEHFQEHARKAQEQIDLALSESRPYLPVR